MGFICWLGFFVLVGCVFLGFVWCLCVCVLWCVVLLYFYFFRLVSKHILEKCLEIVPTFSLFHVCTGIWTFSVAGVI